MNYALDTPIKRTTWTPEDTKWTPVPTHSSQQTQDHRSITWLHHKPQSHAIFPIQPESGRKKQKK
jgi:hypothetical protein